MKENNNKKYFVIFGILIFLVVLILLLLNSCERIKWKTEYIDNVEYKHYDTTLKLDKSNKYEKTYEFEVKSKDDSRTGYSVILVSEGKNLIELSNDNIMISVTKNGKYIVGDKSGVKLSTLSGFNTDSKDGYYNLSTDIIKGTNKDKYKVKLWVVGTKSNTSSYELNIKVFETKPDSINKVTIKLDSDGGKLDSSKLTILEDGKYENLPIPTKKDYTFKGWYTAKENGKLVTENDYYKDIKADTLYAVYEKITYKVVIDPAGGNYDGALVYNSNLGDEITLNTPTKTGYTFAGWNYKSIKNSKFKVTESITIKALWKANKYALTIDPNGGKYNNKTEKQSVDVTYLDTVKLSIPTREGYTFTGWKVEGKGVVKDNIYKSYIGNTVVTATWQINTYKVTFDIDGADTKVNDRSIEFNKEIGDLVSLTKEGHTFEGWYVSDKKIDKTYKITKDTIVIAKFSKNKYRITIDPAGGEYNSKTDIVVTDVTYKDSYTVKKIEKDGYIFAGWEIDGEKYKLENNKLTIGSSNVKLTAKWVKDDFSYIVKHYKQNITDDKYTLVDTDSFVNIKSKTEVTGELKNYEGFVSPQVKKITISTDNSKNVIEYYYDRKTFNLNIKLNGGKIDGSANDITISDLKYEQTYLVKKPVRDGYTFAGWEKTGNGTMTTLFDEATLTIKNENVSLKANWQANTYIITLDANDGVITKASKEVTYDKAYGEFETPTREGYIFLGWYTEKNGGTKVEKDDIVNITSSTTLYAQWVLKGYTLTIKPNGGLFNSSSEDQEFSLYFGQNMNIPKPTREGYTFINWTLKGSKSIISSLTEDAVLTMGSEDAVLEANYKINTYNIILDSNGGDISYNKLIEYNKPYGELEVPTKTGFVFKGWYKGEILINSTDLVTEDATLVAKWETKDVTLTIDYNIPNKENDVINTSYNKLHNITIPTRDGYTFNGWEKINGNSQVNSSSTSESLVIMGTEDTTIMAKWTANDYKVYFETNCTDVQSVSYPVLYGEHYPLYELTRDGYTFKGWYFDLDFTEQVTEDTVLTKTYIHTLYAKWEANDYKLSFDLDGGVSTEDVTDKSIQYNKKIGELPTPTKVGGRFLGWYYNDKLITEDTVYSYSKNITIKARWYEEDYMLTIEPGSEAYYNGGGSVVKMVKYSDVITLSIPTWEGHIFDGWEITGGTAELNSNTISKVRSHTTVEAKWKEYSGRLVINYDDGVTEDKIYDNLGYLSQIEVQNPTRDGYTFTGWKLIGDNARLSDTTFTMGNSDAILTATWTPNTYTYIVKHYQGTNDGKYTLVGADTEEDESLFGTVVTPSVKNYLGFTAPSTKSITVSSNREHNLVEYYYSRNKYNITIDPNGGKYNGSSEVQTKEAYYDDKIGLAIPVKDGYTFSGWTIDNGTIVDNQLTVGASDVTIKANYEANMYMLTYNTNGGGISVGGKVLTYKEKIGELPIPTKAGYDFDGWYSDSLFNNKVTSDDTFNFTDHTTLYAKWIKCDYKLTIDPNDGEWQGTSNPSIIGVNTDGTIEVPVPTRYGYNFDGWVLDGSGTLSSLTSNAIFTGGEGNATITAKWSKKTFTLFYNANGGTVSPLSKRITFNELIGSLDVPVKNGYVFDGWYTSLTDGEVVTGQESITTEGDMHIFARWSLDSFDLTVNPNGGEWIYENNTYTTSKTFTLNYTDTLEIKMPTRKGYRFNSWVFKETETGSTLSSTVSDATFKMGYKDITIEADWSANEYIVIFDPQGGETSLGNKTVVYDGFYGELPIATKKGYTFIGWSTDKNGETNINSDTIVKITETETLYAIYEANTYQINYEANDGVLREISKEVKFGEKYGELTVPVKAGYTLEGWYLNSNLTKKVTKDSSVEIANNHVLYAKWTPNKYNVKFDSNGGVGLDVEEKTFTYDSEYGILPTATKEGFNFVGWYTSKDDTGQLISSSDIVKIVEDTTFYAKFDYIDYNVIFNTNGGEPLDNKIVHYTLKYGELPTPVRGGYAFLGWYLDSLLTKKVTEETIVETLGNHALYAKWEIEKYRVVFDTDGGSNISSKEVTFGKKYGTLEIPTKENYVFTGWYLDVSHTVQVYDSTIVTATSNHTLYAGWTSTLLSPQYSLQAGEWKTFPTTSSTITGNYVVKENTTITGAYDTAAITVKDTAVIYIPKGVTLTLTGGKAVSYGGGAGINLTSGNELIILGEGTLNATGGNAENGETGITGWNGSVTSYYGGWGAAGGDGGGGAGAGIGSNGGIGGAGGSTVFSKSASNQMTNTEAKNGNNGSKGKDSTAAGTLKVLGNVTINATGGAKGNGGLGGGVPTNAPYTKIGSYFYAAAGNGGGGGGGGAGYAANAIGSGGPGGGGGGSGATGRYLFGSLYTFGHGAGGKYGKGASDGKNGSTSTYKGSGQYLTGGTGGSGSTGGSYGANGTMYKSSTSVVNGRTNYTTAETDSKLKYTVMFNGQMSDTTGTQSQSVLYGSKLSSITIPTKEGYKFDGYYLGINGLGTKYIDENGEPTSIYYRAENITLYANWIEE